MRFHLFQGLSGAFSVSGIGQAIRQQESVLRGLGVELTQRPDDPCDVVQLNIPSPASFRLATRARARGAKVVFVAHSTEADIKGSVRGSNLAAPVLRRWLRACFSRADLVLTPTPYSRCLWVDEYGLKVPVRVLSNGVDTTFFAPDPVAGARFRAARGIAPDAKVVVGVGHYFRRKGIVDFVAAARRFPDAQFWWFGHTDVRLVQGDVRSALDAPPSNLHLPGFVGRDELRDAYCGADLFLFPTYEETEGIALLEALACEVPVVVRDIPVYDEWLADAVHVRKFRDESQMDAAIAAILAEPESAAALTAAGRDLAEEHDLRRVGETLARIYEEEGIVAPGSLSGHGGGTTA